MCAPRYKYPAAVWKRIRFRCVWEPWLQAAGLDLSIGFHKFRTIFVASLLWKSPESLYLSGISIHCSEQLKDTIKNPKEQSSAVENFSARDSAFSVRRMPGCFRRRASVYPSCRWVPSRSFALTFKRPVPHGEPALFLLFADSDIRSIPPFPQRTRAHSAAGSEADGLRFRRADYTKP